jgi:hypothetical protein
MGDPRRFQDRFAVEPPREEDCHPEPESCPPPGPPCCNPNEVVANTSPTNPHGHPPFLGGPTSTPDIELYDLIDFSMQVGDTGIVFVAGLTGWREADGSARFLPGAQAAAYRRAASTLAQMALVSGQTFQFLRLALNLSVAQAATLCGETESTITDWEDGTLPVPVSPWQCIADAAASADQRAGITWTALPSVNLRPRRIRIYPDIPYPGVKLPPPNPCQPC